MTDQQQIQCEENFDPSQSSLVQFELNDEIRENCKQLCDKFLAGPWKDLKPDEILVEAVEDGLSNRIYACTNLKLPKSTGSTLGTDVPSKVLVRLYGSQFVGDRGDMIVIATDAVPLIIERLHQKELAPKIYAVFGEGRIEHYIESTKFPQEMWGNDNLLDCLARKMAEIHQLEMPISKDPMSILQMCEKAYETGKKSNQFLSVDLYETEYQPMVKKLLDYDFYGEIKWIKEMSQYIKSTNVFCHNDFHFGNILDLDCGQSFDERVFIIDYDNCSYGSRAYDLAYFLHIKSIIPGRIETWPNYTCTTQVEKRRIIGAYLDHLTKVRKGKIDPEIDTLEHIERELDWANVLLQCVYNAMGISKMNPMMARIFAILKHSQDEHEKLVVLAKERCEQFKQQVIKNSSHSNGNC